MSLMDSCAPAGPPCSRAASRAHNRPPLPFPLCAQWTWQRQPPPALGVARAAAAAAPQRTPSRRAGRAAKRRRVGIRRGQHAAPCAAAGVAGVRGGARGAFAARDWRVSGRPRGRAAGDVAPFAPKARSRGSRGDPKAAGDAAAVAVGSETAEAAPGGVGNEATRAASASSGGGKKAVIHKPVRGNE